MGALDFKNIKDNRAAKVPSKDSYNLKNADRPLSQEEEEAEQKAEKFSLKGFGRIHPNPGTLGFLFRNLRGGNETVIEHLQNAGSSNAAKFIKNFVIIWNNLDEFSKRRVDIFDILCKKYDVPRRKFWGVVQEGMFESNEAIAQIAISEHKGDFIELLKRNMEKEKNAADRKLYAEMAGLIEDKPSVIVENNNVNANITNNNFPIPSFQQSLNTSEKIIKNTKVEPRRLTEGKQDYIEGELISSEEKVLVERTIEEQLEEAAREL